MNGTSNSARRRFQRPHLLGKCGARTFVRFAMQDKRGWPLLKIDNARRSGLAGSPSSHTSITSLIRSPAPPPRWHSTTSLATLRRAIHDARRACSANLSEPPTARSTEMIHNSHAYLFNSPMPDTYNKHGLSRTIPEDVKRQVRQACGFGCVCCGFAIVTYEHIEPEFHNAESHDPENMHSCVEAVMGELHEGFGLKKK